MLWLLSLLTVLSSLPQSAVAVRCGKWFSNACLGDTDPRYDESASNNLADQAEVWKKIEGYWIGEALSYNPDGTPYEAGFLNVNIPFFANAQWPIESFPAKAFRNFTLNGSRMIHANINIFPPPSSEFCELDVPDGFSNAFQGSVCGVNGLSLSGDSFFTSTFEKDGTPTTLGAELGAAPSPNGRSVQISSERAADTLNVLTYTCLNDQCTQVSVASENYKVSPNGTASLNVRNTAIHAKVTEEDWLDAVASGI